METERLKYIKPCVSFVDLDYPVLLGGTSTKTDQIGETGGGDERPPWGDDATSETDASVFSRQRVFPGSTPFMQ